MQSFDGEVYGKIDSGSSRLKIANGKIKTKSYIDPLKPLLVIDFINDLIFLKLNQSCIKRQSNTFYRLLLIKDQRHLTLFDLLYIAMNFKKSVDAKKNSAISSAALQDHLMRNFNFNLDFKISASSNSTISKPPVRKKTHDKLPSINRGIEADIKKLEVAQKTSILPYEDENLKKLKEVKSDQEKMFKYKKGLTLAQKLGLVQAPPLPLTSKDWQIIQQKSKARNDSDNCCSICLEDFKIQPQVILSCSHVFHMKCLNSYEKHNKVKCCPICRRKDYQKKVIDEALRAFTLKSIIRIQRTVRGSKARIALYRRLVESSYAAKSVRFNRRLIGFKMWRLSQKIQENVKKNEHFFNKMLKEIEQKHQKSKQDILDEMVQIQRNKLLNQNKIQQYLEKFGISRKPKGQQSKIDWQTVKSKGIERKDDQCSICLMNLWNKPVYLLSCTHLFHVNCIEGFQRYAIPGNQNKCPCCRSHYEKKLVQVK